jgi:acyl carrier protein
MSVEDQLRSFIIENFLYGEGGDALKNDDSFLQKGIIDSTGTLELVAFLERTYGFKVADHELVPSHLDSIDRLVAFVAKKKGPS